MNVRISELGFEGLCNGCGDYWPLTFEFWPIRRLKPVRTCRACVLAPMQTQPYREYRLKGGTLDYREWRREYNRTWMRRYRARTAA